jgi:hypothetical protein
MDLSHCREAKRLMYEYDRALTTEDVLQTARLHGQATQSQVLVAQKTLAEARSRYLMHVSRHGCSLSG